MEHCRELPFQEPCRVGQWLGPPESSPEVSKTIHLNTKKRRSMMLGALALRGSEPRDRGNG